MMAVEEGHTDENERGGLLTERDACTSMRRV